MGDERAEFLERTFCCKVKTKNPMLKIILIFLERTFCCKVKTQSESEFAAEGIFRKNILL